MASAPPKNTFAKSHASLLKGLGMPTARKYSRAILEWSRWAGFPKRERNGWRIDLVRDWFDLNASEIAKYWTRIELASGKVKQGAVRTLQAGTSAGPPDAATAPAPPDPNKSLAGDESVLGMADTDTALAAMLSIFYGNRIGILVNAQTVQDWRKRRRLPSGDTPPPPGVENGGKYRDARKYRDWFDKHLLQHYTAEPTRQGELIPAAKLERMRVEDSIAELESNKKRREIEDGKWVEKDMALRVLARICLELNQRLTGCERVLTRQANAALDADHELPDSQRMRLKTALADGARTAVDELRALLALREHTLNLEGIE